MLFETAVAYPTVAPAATYMVNDAAGQLVVANDATTDLDSHVVMKEGNGGCTSVSELSQGRFLVISMISHGILAVTLLSTRTNANTATTTIHLDLRKCTVFSSNSIVATQAFELSETNKGLGGGGYIKRVLRIDTAPQDKNEDVVQLVLVDKNAVFLVLRFAILESNLEPRSVPVPNAPPADLHCWSVWRDYRPQLLESEKRLCSSMVVFLDSDTVLLARPLSTVCISTQHIETWHWHSSRGMRVWELLAGFSSGIVHINSVRAICSCGNQVFTLNWDGSVNRWTLEDGKPTAVYTLPVTGLPDPFHWKTCCLAAQVLSQQFALAINIQTDWYANRYIAVRGLWTR